MQDGHFIAHVQDTYWWNIFKNASFKPTKIVPLKILRRYNCKACEKGGNTGQVKSELE
jgi:hypothetical protein